MRPYIGLVHPAAQIPYIATQCGARGVHINVVREPVDEEGVLVLIGKAAERLPQLLTLVNRA